MAFLPFLNRTAEIFDRYRVETGKQHFRYPADDCRQYLRDRPCNPDGCAGCHSYFGVSFPLLSEKFYGICKSGINLMAGIPSIVYGFFGLVVIVPLMAQLTGKNGNTMLTASILLAVMILPTVVGVTESAITSVPESYYEASLGLGATHSQSVFFAVVPAAKSGILAGIVLGIGRAIGETMAVIMIAGNQPRMPKGITEGLRTMTANIVLEMGYASGLHREALIATGVVLFVFILLINLSVSMLNRRVHDGD